MIDNFRLSILSKNRSEIYGLSILWIMLFHGTICGIHYSSVLRLLNIGNIGVEIFLFLSGISLYYSFSKNQNLRLYTFRRITRLLIPVITVSGLYWLYLLFSDNIGLFGLLSRLMGLHFWLTGDQQIWFLSFLMLAYILYPYYWYFLFSKEGTNRLYLARMILLVALSISITILIKIYSADFYINTEIALTRFPVFIIGALAGKYVYEQRKVPNWIIIPCTLAVGVVFIVLSKGLTSGIISRYIYMVAGIPLTIILGWIFDRLSNTVIGRIMTYLGRMSIELYIAHIMLIHIYKRGVVIQYTPGSIGKYMIILALSIGFSSIMYVIDSKITYLLRNDNGKNVH